MVLLPPMPGEHSASRPVSEPQADQEAAYFPISRAPRAAYTAVSVLTPTATVCTTGGGSCCVRVLPGGSSSAH